MGTFASPFPYDAAARTRSNRQICDALRSCATPRGRASSPVSQHGPLTLRRDVPKTEVRRGRYAAAVNHRRVASLPSLYTAFLAYQVCEVRPTEEVRPAERRSVVLVVPDVGVGADIEQELRDLDGAAAGPLMRRRRPRPTARSVPRGSDAAGGRTSPRCRPRRGSRRGATWSRPTSRPIPRRTRSRRRARRRGPARGCAAIRI